MCATHATNASSGAFTALNGAASAGAIWAAATASIPSHITGAIAAAASRLAGSAASETCSKCSAISGAVPTVAATVIAATSATGPGSARVSAPRMRRRERQQRDDGGERQLPARLTGHARVERERDRCGEPERVPAVRGPAGERGDEPRRAHDPGALDRRPGAGERHVHGHQHERQRQPHAQRDAGGRARGKDERCEQHHVLAADRQHVREPRALEVVAHVVRELLVLAQHHAAHQRRLRLGQPASQPSLGATARGVDDSRRPAPALAGDPQARHVDRGVRAAAPLVGVEAAERRDRARQLDDLAHARPPAHVRGRPHAGHRAVTGGRPTEQPDACDRGPARPFPHGLEHDGARRDRLPVHPRQAPAVQRRDSQLGDDGPEQHRRGRRDRERTSGRAAQHQHGGSCRCQHRRRR